MIVSHKHKFIFIKTHKTAGSSLEMALANICGPDDIISRLNTKDETARKNLGYVTAQNDYVPFSAYRLKDWYKFLVRGHRLFYRNHWPAKRIKRYIPKHQWESYFIFCFERNPYEKIISWHYWVRRKTKLNISEFLNVRSEKIRAELEMYHINGKLAVDKMYAYEELQEALADISDRLSLTEPLTMPEYRAKGNIRTDRRPFAEVLSQKEMKTIYDIYYPVFELLGYEKTSKIEL
ncbi:MAG: sulfotransferase family 2 domain-containing protein [Marinoscillum sp.]|uniref:sulfotransferase family 2 domain-containing protein n=1 Tax=Marinoscillum sp. TaxID=2024838 RepID=UPI0032F82764